jgi:hypothetical protein
MDTTWFAVDADGNVGVFDTGEAGALPTAAGNAGGTADPSFDTFLFDATRLAHAFASEPERLERAAAESRGAHADAASMSARVVVVVDPRLADGFATHRTTARPATLEVDHPEGRWRVVREASPRVLVASERLPRESLAAIVARADVTLAVAEHDLYDLLEDAPGLFRFEHDGEGPGGYLRAEGPAAPLRLDDVPVEDRVHVGALALPVRFGETERIELRDHLADADCAFWDPEGTLSPDPPEDAPVVAAAPPPPRSGARRWVVAAVVVAGAAIAWILARR